MGYNALTSDVEPTAEKVVEVNKPLKDIYVKYIPEEEIQDIDDNPLLGKYSATVENEKLTAEITFELMAEQKIKHYRSVNRNGIVTEGTVEGQYVIDGDLLEFTFPQSRDKEVFPMGMLILKVAKNNNISSGKVNFVKS
tara:strand:- start:523 stop:939 length:417 start_codon:yes stop_codon:yes gene_type:complete